jgi:hypothetical protein
VTARNLVKRFEQVILDALIQWSNSVELVKPKLPQKTLKEQSRDRRALSQFRCHHPLERKFSPLFD